jgi:hypothetical protein
MSANGDKQALDLLPPCENSNVFLCLLNIVLKYGGTNNRSAKNNLFILLRFIS